MVCAHSTPFTPSLCRFKVNSIITSVYTTSFFSYEAQMSKFYVQTSYLEKLGKFSKK